MVLSVATRSITSPFWNLSLFYLNIDDPQVEKDLQQITADTKSFVQKYQGKVAGLSSQVKTTLSGKGLGA